MFEKSLTDLVRGIRNNKKNEAKFISQCIQEIKEELKQDMAKKTVAIQKLTYLQMLGYDMSWAAFNVIEVMSQQRFTSKRIGYLAASQSFHEGTEVVMLATNLLKKDFTANNQYEAGLAINALSNICNPDLARDLASDIVALMNSSKPYVRKKGVLVMYKIFLKFPDSLRPSFPKLKEKLDDPEQSVISAAVNVICELARKNPKGYLSLAPVLFKLLTTNYNNWMLIKIIKLFGALTPYEPRLAKKLVDPLSNLINTTPAMSLIYECIQTCTIGMAEHLPIIKLCISKLSAFVEDPDQNLKYLGLLALNNIMKIHPKAVAEHRDLVLNCLDDEDVTIRMRALDLLTGMVTKRNLPEIVRKLLEHMERAEGSYRDELVNKIIVLCSQSSYAYITDFEWYITVLVQLTHVHGTTHGSLIASQVLDVVIRVKVVRRFGVRQMNAVLRDPRLLSNPEVNGVCEVLYAAAWITGEFARYVDNPLETIDALLHPRVAVLPAHIQSIYMHSALKLFSFLVASAYGHLEDEETEEEEAHEPIDIQPETVSEASDVITSRLPDFTQSVHTEVQERACFVLEVLRLYNNLKDQDDGEISAELAALFEEPLNPVAKGAIKKVPIPEDLDLDTPLNEEPPEEPDEDEPEPFANEEEDEPVRHTHRGIDDDEEEEEEDIWESEKKKKASEPPKKTQRPHSDYYLGPSKSQPKPQIFEEPQIPVVALPQSSLGPMVVGQPKKQQSKKAKSYTVDTTEELPEGAIRDDDAKTKKEKKTGKPATAEDALAEISLDAPLGEHEILPVQRHRTDVQREREQKAKADAEAAQREEKRRQRGEPGRRPRPPGEEGGRPHRPARTRPPKQTEGQLIDIMGDDAGPTSGPNTTAAGPNTTATGKPTGLPNLLDDDYQEVNSPAMEASRAPAGRPTRRPRPEGERRHRPEGERPRRPRPEGEGGERPRRPRSSTAGSEGKEPAAAAAAAPTSPTNSNVRPKLRPLFDGDDLRAAYDVRSSATEKGKVTVYLVIENKSDTEISHAELQLTDTMTVRLVRAAPGAPSEIGEVAGHMRVQHQLALNVSSVTIAQKLKGVISYEYLGDTRKAEFLLPLPVSAFVANVTLTKEQFAATLANDSSLSLSSARVKIIGDFKSTVTAITNAVHAEPVQVSANVASAYGKSVLGHHVAMLIKEKAGEGVVSVDIKCGDATLGNALVQELNVLR